MTRTASKKRPTVPDTVEVSPEMADEIRKAQQTGKPSPQLQRWLAAQRAPASESAHRTVSLRHGRVSALVDEKIAPLVLETWRASIPTTLSCEDAGPRGLGHDSKPGRMQIAFPTTSGARRWLTIVCEKRPQRRILHVHMVDEDRRWEFSMGPPCWGRTGVDMSVMVFFPKSELPSMLRRLRAHNRRRSA